VDCSFAFFSLNITSVLDKWYQLEAIVPDLDRNNNNITQRIAGERTF